MVTDNPRALSDGAAVITSLPCENGTKRAAREHLTSMCACSVSTASACFSQNRQTAAAGSSSQSAQSLWPGHTHVETPLVHGAGPTAASSSPADPAHLLQL